LRSSAAASSPPPTDQSPADGDVTGTLALPLITQSGGQTYRLLSTLSITGPTSQTLETGLTEQTVLTTTLPIGQYTLTLVEGWRLQLRVGDSYEDVEATFVFANGIPFRIAAGATETVRLRFTLPLGGSVSFDGTLAVELEVGASCDLLDDTCGGTDACYLLLGDAAPVSVCANAGSAGIGEPCQFVNSCAPGSFCTTTGCQAYCDVTDPFACPNQGLCEPLGIGDAGACR
jgi:hypothetical protein